MEKVALIVFGLFLLTLLALDIAMVVSLMKTGDERRQLIVWKSSSFTLLVVAGSLIIDIAQSIVTVEAMQINPSSSSASLPWFISYLFYIIEKGMELIWKTSSKAGERTGVFPRRTGQKMRRFPPDHKRNRKQQI